VRVNGSGAAVGLSEAMTQIPRLGTVRADTHIEAFYLNTMVFEAIMERNETVRALPAPAWLAIRLLS
jgi:hypothetical protein